MKTQQPAWKLVANLGDVGDPLQYGGYFVYVDQTGVYNPEAEVLTPNVGGSFTLHRFGLEPCTLIGGVLSDTPFRPTYPVWFADDLSAMAECSGIENLVSLFCSPDPLQRAVAWEVVGEYHGWENLDPYPRTLTTKQAKEHVRTRMMELKS